MTQKTNHIQCIPGRSDILGNEMADYVAKQACSENSQLPGVTYTFICARIIHMVKNPLIEHERTAEIYRAYSSSTECQIRSRRNQTRLAKLRTGKYKGLHLLEDLTLHAPSAIRICKIFNTDCRDAERQRTWDLIFSVRTQEGWIAWQSTLYR